MIYPKVVEFCISQDCLGYTGVQGQEFNPHAAGG